MFLSDPICALVFPGQGSQREGMSRLVEQHEPELFEAAGRLVGEDPFGRVDDGTKFQQPAIYCASIAAWTALGRPTADIAAGHSLGEIAALVAAGSLEPLAGLELVVERSAAMQQATLGSPTGLVAVVGARESIDALDLPIGVTPANDNAPRQVVFGGPLDALAELRTAARATGLKAIRLPVVGASHTSAMNPAVAPFRAALARVDFRQPRYPVISGVTAQPFEDIATRLVQSVISPVRWREVVKELYRRGVRHFIEPGPGDILSRLIAQQFEDVSFAAKAEAGVA